MNSWIIVAIVVVVILAAAYYTGTFTGIFTNTTTNVSSNVSTNNTNVSNVSTNYSNISTLMNVNLSLIANGLVAPTALASPQNDTGRLFVADQVGVIWTVDNGTMTQEPFLDLRNQTIGLNPAYDERGLLGFALHPNFTDNGRFFVYYSMPLRSGAPSGWDHTDRLSEFTLINSSQANASSERVIFEIDKPESNHNGGGIAFGPDGYLYISVGDGGSENDIGMGHNPQIGNGQDITVPFGKILRIDVNTNNTSAANIAPLSTPNTGTAPITYQANVACNNTSIPGNLTLGYNTYGIPPGNPFVGSAAGLSEIYAYGLRNPFRISFDGSTLFAGDAGQNSWEEVDSVTKGGNYGWNIKEGTFCFNASNPNVTYVGCTSNGYRCEPLINPIIEYPNLDTSPNGIGHAVIGGFMYRGSNVTGLYGKYVFGDLSSSFTTGNGSLLVATPSSGLWQIQRLGISSRSNGMINEFVRSFGEDSSNELYVLTSGNLGPTGSTGKVYKIVTGGATNATGNVTNNTTGVTEQVAMSNLQFVPSSLTISVGDTVAWTNMDSTDHTITGFGVDVTVPSGGTYNHTFNQTGTFNYVCRIHSGMAGTITVS